ncbi:MAG: FAD-dependent oxidoreductase [Atopobiaceae bacterium]|jgi:thioredoxin reductase (NADPH)|nr:FAD-dependent oxidoreductase [Atopobiaceae bacterium]MCH4213962.1 FAD-dependent oxidoreductase [Atopobiaceae bacterium]MCH4230188.1 FAD-dependent oxidoreductase [Atopobiaceae bacterium]MCH4275575.1 FAD-dependent oxidoreductase [Atopobiaceae bacterium]MCI1226368.1 FAD-dependent oxidoreductase [Atopobiaceae bacterium]
MSEDLTVHDLVIVGGGPAGLSASIYASRALLDAVTVEQGAFGGQAAITDQIENYPGVETINGAELGMRMQAQAESLGGEFVYDAVTGIDYDEGSSLFTCSCESEPKLVSRSVILATGGTPRHAGFTGEEEYAGHGVSYCATCDGMFYRGKPVYVIGGGNTACEEALFLTRFASHVTLIVRKDHVRATPAIAEQLGGNDKITVRYLTSVAAVHGNDGLCSITLHDNASGRDTNEDFSEGGFGVFVFVGHVPSTELISDLVHLTPAGTVTTDERMETSLPGLFCAGDAREKPLRQVITAASDGVIAATSAAQFLGQTAE